jgi:hypothetical protein
MLLKTQLPLILPNIWANKMEMFPNSTTDGIYIFVKLKVKHWFTKAGRFPRNLNSKFSLNHIKLTESRWRFRNKLKFCGPRLQFELSAATTGGQQLKAILYHRDNIGYRNKTLTQSVIVTNPIIRKPHSYVYLSVQYIHKAVSVSAHIWNWWPLTVLNLTPCP